MKKILNRLFRHEELTQEEAKNLLQQVTEGCYNETQLASLLTVYQMRSIRVPELLGFREALLNTRIPIDLSAYHPVDIVGTGGDGKNTFNVSTCACFVVAGAGYRVAKHGNYGATSISGASNVMEQHGVKFTNQSDLLQRSMEGCGLVYLHAPLFYPALKNVASIRKKQAYFRRIEAMKLKNPLLVGFGISNRQTLKAANAHAAGAIIGSKFVQLLEAYQGNADLAIEQLKRQLETN